MSTPELKALDQMIDWSEIQAHFSDHKTCKVCGTTFKADNPAKVTCSAKCRQRLYRLRVKVKASIQQ